MTTLAVRLHETQPELSDRFYNALTMLTFNGVTIADEVAAWDYLNAVDDLVAAFGDKGDKSGIPERPDADPSDTRPLFERIGREAGDRAHGVMTSLTLYLLSIKDRQLQKEVALVLRDFASDMSGTPRLPKPAEAKHHDQLDVSDEDRKALIDQLEEALALTESEDTEDDAA